jgi:hypothetical protein
MALEFAVRHRRRLTQTGVSAVRPPSPWRRQLAHPSLRHAVRAESRKEQPKIRDRRARAALFGPHAGRRLICLGDS